VIPVPPPVTNATWPFKIPSLKIDSLIISIRVYPRESAEKKFFSVSLW